jgi:hypothetical protein
MRKCARLAGAAAAVALAVGFSTLSTEVADAGSATSPLACTGILANADLPANKGAGSTACESTTPQPLSHADMTDHGANTTAGSNPYAATGFGQVQGGHLAGTEGKADNKFPLGQAPNGTDLNRGFECDQNPGIGNGNPAHTTCRFSSSSVTPPLPSGVTVIPSPASGVLSEVVTQQPASVTETPLAAQATTGALAFTGLAALWLAFAGLVLIGFGFALIWLTGRAPQAHSRLTRAT